MPNLKGQSIGPYHIIEQLGQGGMATVYKAYDTRLERNVAIKVLRTDQFIPAQLQQVLQRFEREAKSLAKLSNPNIVHIIDYGEHQGMPYLVMEYLPGGTLKQKLGHAIFWRDAVQILLPVARGLAYAHQHGIIHRDVKPANILMDETDAPILTDFGIAKLLESTDGHTLTVSGVGIGTPEYMAPEQGMGSTFIDARADIYSLGIVLYEMVVGRKPYVADTPMAVVLKQITDPLPRPTEFIPDLPEYVEHILFKALAKKPEDRYADMNALIAAMGSLLVETQKVEAPAPIAATSTWQADEKVTPRPRPSPKVVLAVIGALALILMAVFGLPRMRKQLSVAPVAATSTIALAIVPTSTLLPPSVTPETSPTLASTKTPRPSATHLPAPAWVQDFAQPILADIQSRAPDFQDDFEHKSNFWVPADFCSSPARFKIANGVMSMTNCHVHWTRNYDNFVIVFDMSNPGMNGGLNFYMRESSSFVGCNFGFKPDGYIAWGCSYPYNVLKDIGYDSAVVKHIIIIVHGDQFAIYVNEKPVEKIQVEILKYGNSWLAGSGQVDNFKLWRIP